MLRANRKALLAGCVERIEGFVAAADKGEAANLLEWFDDYMPNIRMT